MCKIRNILMLAAILTTSQVFAKDLDSDSKACATIAKACKEACFTRTSTDHKRFWKDCMKPILLGQQVSGVTVDPNVVKTCRMDKIKQLKKKLDQLEKAN